jgi:DNA-binding XRE family transcriptional regulator
VPGPYVSRHRVAQELQRLRAEHGHTIDSLARTLDVSRQRISNIENGGGASEKMVDTICDHFKLGGLRRKKLHEVATNSRAKGWWAQHEKEMGYEQALTANLECGAVRICEYQLSLIPGLLQTEEYSDARVQADPSAAADGFDPARSLDARRERQQRVATATDLVYDVVIDELAIRRAPTSAGIMRRQLQRLLDVSRSQGSATIRILPIDANIVGQAVPRSAFSVYQYPDPDDPVVVTADTMAKLQVHLEPAVVGIYRSSYERFRAAALTPQRTRNLLASLAGDLQEIG